MWVMCSKNTISCMLQSLLIYYSPRIPTHHADYSYWDKLDNIIRISDQ
jgi:hypothetical protein